MAKEEAKLVVKVDDKASKKIKKVDKSFLGLAKSLAPVAAGFFGVRAGMEAMKDAADFESVQRSFESLSASQGQSSSAMLANMKELSAGTVSDLELMKQANTALLLGLPVEKFGDMLKIARSSSKATGQSMEFMLNSIVTGLGRGSKLILDNLGIVFDANKANQEYAETWGIVGRQLTDAEKKQAFINKDRKSTRLNSSHT